MMSMKFAITVLVTSLLLAGCASTKPKEGQTIYTNTGGLHLLFDFSKKESGWLFINGKQDSIPFSYTLTSQKLRANDVEKDKEKQLTLYRYQVVYQGNKAVRYKILKKFETLVTYEPAKLVRYEPKLAAKPRQ